MSTRNDRDVEDLLGDDAGRIGAAYRKLGKQDPPRRLDRNVLAEASRAVHGRPRSSAWLLGIGTAAGVMLAAGIAWRVNHDMVKQRETVPASSPATEAIQSDVIRVEPRAKSNDNDNASDRAARLNEQFSAADAEVAGAASAKSNSPFERKSAQAKQKLDETFVPDPAVRKSVPKPTQEASGEQEELREQAAPMSPLAPPQPVAAAPRLVPVPDESKEAKGIRDSAEAEGPAASEPMHKVEGARQSAADGLDISTRRDTRRERASSFGDADVTAEIDRIRALLRAGQRDAALDALRELRHQRPDVVLPVDLRALDG